MKPPSKIKYKDVPIKFLCIWSVVAWTKFITSKRDILVLWIQMFIDLFLSSSNVFPVGYSYIGSSFIFCVLAVETENICRAHYIKTLHCKSCISYVNWLMNHHWGWAFIQSSSLILVFTSALLCGLKSKHLTCCLLQRILPWFWVQSDELAALNQFSPFFFRLILFLYPLFTCFNLEYLIAKYVILKWNVWGRKF